MAKTIRLSTIIRKARDEHLWDGCSHHDFISNKNLSVYSCWAIDNFMSKLKLHEKYIDRTYEIIEQYGCDTGSGKLFNEFKTDELKQGARFLWLSFMIEATKNVKIKL